MIKKSRQKFKYFESENNFWGEIERTFIILKDFPLPKIVLDQSVRL